MVKPVSSAPPAAAPSAPSPAETPPAPPPEVAMPSLGERVVDLASGYVGWRYVFGGASPQSGFDCSGLVQFVMNQLGVDVGRVVWQQYQRGTPVGRDELQPGDLVFFSNTYMPGLSHVGIYVGDGVFVDAGTERTGVRRANIDDAYWSVRFSGARRLS